MRATGEWVAAWASGWLLIAATALAGPIYTPWSLDHNALWTPLDQTYTPASAEIQYFGHSWSTGNGSSYDTTTPIQDPTFNPYGTFSISPNGDVQQNPKVNQTVVGVPIINGVVQWNLYSGPPAMYIDGLNNVQRLGPSGSFQFQSLTRTSGSFDIPVLDPRINYYMWGSANAVMRGNINMSRGNLRWSPVLNLKGQPGARTRIYDPWSVHYSAFGGSFFDVFVDIELEVEDEGEIDWDSIKVGPLINADLPNDGFIRIHVPPEFVLPGQSGELEVVVHDGVVTSSSDSGIFDGLVPAVGSSGTFSMPLGPIEVDYNLNNPLITDAALVMGGGASSMLIVPEPTGGVIIMVAVAAGLSRRRRFVFR